MAVRSFDGITPVLDDGVYVDEQAAVIGDVHIGKDSSIWPMVALRGDVQSIRIGKRTNVQDGSILHVTADNAFNPGGHALTIGDEVTVGHAAILHACTVEDRCLVGMGATVLDGAVVKTNTMVAAGALVPPGKVLESGFLYVGAPVKQARALSQKEIEYLSFSAQHYVDLKNRHMKDQ
ncbi:MAG: gamma carbonic anhydrase family protein [Gammaproteobacteria bacterium]|nr:gamma carbonic anhydrase family protein [Gammaproteobacteria bacterium]